MKTTDEGNRLSELHATGAPLAANALARPADDQVRLALSQALGLGDQAAPFELTRAPCDQQSTFPLERLEVRLADATALRLAFKRLQWSSLDEAPQPSRPSFVFDPEREPAVYETLLPLAPKGPPRYFGSISFGAANERWLFVEWVQGRELHQIGELSTWAQAAGWLGAMHRSLAAEVEDHVRTAGLLRHDEAHCTRWALRASEFAAAIEGETARTRRLERVLERYDIVLQALMQMPRTIVHGDFYASNVLIAKDGERMRIAPVDWEMAAEGPGLIDLAALISGDWNKDERQTMIAAYEESAGDLAFSDRQLDFARLHHAVRRLGWAPPGWTPPPSQRHDWLGEAIEIADRLGL